MLSDVHTAALRAAAKVAFSVAFLGGCSAANPAAETDEDPIPGAGEPGTSEADLTGKPKHKPKVVVPASTACHGNDASAPKPSCEAVVNAAFPTEGHYPGTKQAVSKEVQTCCVELLTADSSGESDAGAGVHRWDCCANLPPGGGGNITVMACTPWGPPVPPAMKRRAKSVLLAEVA